MLIVETIGRRGRPGCEIARVNAQRADANARARAEADLRAGHFRCGRDQRAPKSAANRPTALAALARARL